MLHCVLSVAYRVLCPASFVVLWNYDCPRFDNSSKQCRSKEIFDKCYSEHNPPYKAPKSFHCSATHSSLSLECTELKHLHRIKELMAFHNLTFFEAFNIIPHPSTNTNLTISQKLSTSFLPTKRRTRPICFSPTALPVPPRNRSPNLFPPLSEIFLLYYLF